MGDDGTNLSHGYSFKNSKRLEIKNKWRNRGVTDADQLERIADKVMRKFWYR